MADLTIFNGRLLESPTRGAWGNGHWLCDGMDADQWAEEAMARTHEAGEMGGEALDAFAISGALQALDTRECDY